MSFCIRLSNFIQIGPYSVELWCSTDFQDGGHWGWRPPLQNVNVYQPFRSIRVWVITISGLEKQTSVILEFFFRLVLRPYHSNRRAIPHRANKFRPNLATRGGVMTSYTISRWRQRWFSTTSGFVYNDITLIRRSKSIRKPNFIDISQFTAETQLLPVWIRYDFSAILECFFRLRLRP